MRNPDFYYFDYSQIKGPRFDGLPLWSFSLFDVHFALRYLLFEACQTPTSLEVVSFLVKAFRHCGIPTGLYVDADELIRSPRLLAFARMISDVFEQRGHYGDFQLQQLPPANPLPVRPRGPQYTIIEAYYKLIRHAGREPDLNGLNSFTLHVFADFQMGEFVRVGLPSGGTAMVRKDICRETMTALDHMLRAAAAVQRKE